MKLLSRISLFVVLIVFSFQQVNTLYQFVYFKANENEVVMEFCVNKDKPEMQCNGKCHLAKKIETEPNFNFILKTCLKPPALFPPRMWEKIRRALG